MYYHILLLTSTKAEANTLIGLQICEILLMHTLLKFRPLHIRTLYHNKKTNVINSHHTPLGQPCMIQCQWLIYSNPHNVHIYISGSPRNNIFTHTLNIDNACYASHSRRLFSKPFIVERISGFRIVQYVHNQKLIFKKLFWWCISFALIKKTQKPSAIFM